MITYWMMITQIRKAEHVTEPEAEELFRRYQAEGRIRHNLYDGYYWA